MLQSGKEESDRRKTAASAPNRTFTTKNVNLDGAERATDSDERPVRLTDQAVDSKVYIKRYLDYNRMEAPQHQSLMENRPAGLLEDSDE